MENKEFRLLRFMEAAINAAGVEEYNVADARIGQFVSDNRPLASGKLGDLIIIRNIDINGKNCPIITISRYHTNPYIPKEVFEHSFYLPSCQTYKRCDLHTKSGNKDIIDTVEIETDKGIKITNFREMKKKLIEVSKPYCEKEIQDSFDSLVNERIIVALPFKTYPKTLKDKLFGTLKHDGSGTYEGKFGYKGKTVAIDIFFEQEETEKDFVQKLVMMHKLVNSDSFDKAYKRMISDMLKLKNDYWLDENETELSEEEFIKPLRLNTIHLNDNGESSLNYFAAELFGGHDIMIDLDSDGNYIDSSI